MLYLLDTNAASDLIRQPFGSVARKVDMVGDHNVTTSVIVACELRFGVARRSAPRLAERIEGLLMRLLPLPFNAPADTHYAEIRSHLASIGTPIGSNDLFIAAHARALGATLVTDNVREFARVPGLTIENWRS